MGGRLVVRRLVTTTLPGLVIALALVLLPSMGSSLVPTAALVAATPAATVVHLLGDEIVAAPPGPAPAVHARAVAPIDPSVAVLVVAMAALVALGATTTVHRRAARIRTLLPIPITPGRSPPSRLHHR